MKADQHFVIWCGRAVSEPVRQGRPHVGKMLELIIILVT
jgi:hypothetical protein